MAFSICQFGLVDSTLALEHKQPSFNPRYSRYIAVWMTTESDCPLSSGSTPSGRLKNQRDIDKWLFLSLCLSVRGMSVTKELGLD